MSWIGINDFQSPLFARMGLDSRGTPRSSQPMRDDDEALLTEGTLVIEAPHPAVGSSQVLNVEIGTPWPTKLRLTLFSEGRAEFEVFQGADQFRVSVDYDIIGGGNDLRVSYLWSAQQQTAWLFVEALDDGSRFSARRAAPPPLPFFILARAFETASPEVWSTAARSATLSDRLEPVILSPAFTAGTPIATDRGWRAVEGLRPGDRILTADGGAQELTAISRRDVPAVGSFAPVRLRAPYLGLARDLMVSSVQKVLLRGENVAYQFGTEEVLAEARHLVASGIARVDRPAWLVRYFDLALPHRHLIGAAGGRFEIQAQDPGPVRRPVLGAREALSVRTERVA